MRITALSIYCYFQIPDDGPFLPDFEFIPEAFLEPRSQKLALQTELVHSQMFHSLIAKYQGRDEKEQPAGSGARFA